MMLFKIRLSLLLLFCLPMTAAAQYSANPLSQAVDNTEYNFVTEGSANFFKQSAESIRGGSAAQSGRISAGQISVMAVEVQGPTTLRFQWKVSSQKNRDVFGIVVLDKNKQPSGISQFISGERDWQAVSIDIPAGKFFPTWGYAKDGSGSSGQDAGWVDQIRIGSSPALPVAQRIGPIVNFLLNEPLTEVDIPNGPQLRPAMPAVLDRAFIFRLESEQDPFDFVGQGQDFENQSPNDEIAVTVNARHIVRLSIGPKGQLGGDWSVEMFNDEQRLEVGSYSNVPAPVYASGQVGFAISGMSRTCGEARRSDFTIHQIGYASSGKPNRLVMDFVQKCHPNSGRLFGSIVYDERLPDD